MSEFGDALGTGVEGGLFARAVGGRDPSDPDRPPERGHFSEEICLNCGARLIGAHCHACGQKAHLHRTLGAFLHDLLHGALHFEGRTWKTLPLLAFRPGQLTRRYIDGERARFVSPMALFLFSIFLMFAVFQAIGLTTPTDIATPAQVEGGIESMRESVTSERDRLEGRLTTLEEGSAEHAQTLAALDQANERLAGIDQAGAIVTDGEGLARLDLGKTGWSWFDGVLDKWRSNPGLMLYKMQANSYKFSWLLIPLSIPFMWLLFAWKRRYRAYDHAIFVTYSIAFMSLLFITISVLVKIGAPDWLWGSLIAFAPPIHIYKQLRGTYALARFSALWRLAVILVFVAIILTLFLQILLVLGAF